MKKTFIISASLLGVILLFLGIYDFAFLKNDQPAGQKNATMQTAPSASQNQALGNKPAAAIAPVSKGGAFGVFDDKKSKQLLYYSAVDGTVWQLSDSGGNPTEFSSTPLSGIENAQWSLDRNMVITEFNHGGQNAFYSYNYTTKKSAQLKDGIDTVAWDSLGKEIIYKYFNQATKKRSLEIALPDGTTPQVLIADLPLRNVSIAPIPLSSIISYWNTPTSKEATQLNIVGVTGGTQKTIFSGKFGADYLWSPDGSHALVSSLDSLGSSKVSLGTIDSYGANYKDLGVSTLVSKCVWSQDSKTVYCAVPGTLPAGTIMPDDYMSKKVLTTDTFVKIDVQTGESSLLLQPQQINGDYDATDLVLSSAEKNLFFINRKDGKLYMMSL